jgi:hypothetical protein
MKEERIEELRRWFSKVKDIPETEEELLETISYLAIMAEALVAVELGYAGWAGAVSNDAEIDEEAVISKFQDCPMLNMISLHLTHFSENLKLCPHPEDGIEAFREWFECAAKKYNSRSEYHRIFELAKKIRKIIV